MRFSLIFIALVWSSLAFAGCQSANGVAPTVNPPVVSTPGSVTQPAAFWFGGDVSFVNQILDHAGVYYDQNELRSPYRILHDYGTNVARFRLWHNPTQTKTVYGTAGTQLYNDIADVERGIRLAKAQGMAVCLDIHYSDTWADPSKQEVPQAWIGIKTVQVLADSVYNYTARTLQRLNSQGLMPEIVQIGNEINCGMLYGQAPADFPNCNVCANSRWAELGQIINSGIRAVRTVSATSTTKTQVLLHVADPKNVTYWFDNIGTLGKVTDFDVVGFSYYPLWHTTVSVQQLSASVAAFKRQYGRAVMILETGYPWTTANNDNYANLFGTQPAVSGYPFTQQGQLDMLKTITQQLKDGGGTGIMYWEPAWITSQNKDFYGTGSAWDNTTLFDFSGKPTLGMGYMTYSYK